MDRPYKHVLHYWERFKSQNRTWEQVQSRPCSLPEPETVVSSFLGRRYSNFRKYAHPLHVKEGIITEKVFPVFSESFFWTCFGLVMYIWELMGVTEKFAFQMWKNNIDLLGFMRELLRVGIFTVIFFPENMPNPTKYAYLR